MAHFKFFIFLKRNMFMCEMSLVEQNKMGCKVTHILKADEKCVAGREEATEMSEDLVIIWVRSLQ